MINVNATNVGAGFWLDDKVRDLRYVPTLPPSVRVVAARPRRTPSWIARELRVVRNPAVLCVVRCYLAPSRFWRLVYADPTGATYTDAPGAYRWRTRREAIEYGARVFGETARKGLPA